MKKKWKKIKKLSNLSNICQNKSNHLIYILNQVFYTIWHSFNILANDNIF